MLYNRTVQTAKHHYSEIPSDQHPVLPEQYVRPIHQPHERKDYSPNIPILDLAAIARSIA